MWKDIIAEDVRKVQARPPNKSCAVNEYHRILFPHPAHDLKTAIQNAVSKFK